MTRTRENAPPRLHGHGETEQEVRDRPGTKRERQIASGG